MSSIAPVYRHRSRRAFGTLANLIVAVPGPHFRAPRVTGMEEPDAGGGQEAAPGRVPGRGSRGLDPRFSFANERTFLAWVRTSLALVAGGLAVTQFIRPFSLPAGRRIIGLPLIALGGFVAFASHRNWTANETAMEAGRPLPKPWVPRIVAVGVGITAIVAAVLVTFWGGGQ